MARDYAYWAAEPGVVSEINKAFGREIYGDLRGGELQAAVNAIGKRQLAMLLSGAESTKDRGYKNAHNNISRWMRGARGTGAAKSRRKPNAASQQRIVDIARAWRHKQLRARGALRVMFIATLRTSKTVWRKGKVEAMISGPDLADFVSAIENEDAIEAMQIVTEAYGLDPDVVEEVQEFHHLEIT